MTLIAIASPALISSSSANAETSASVVVVFFRGLCNSTDACRANEQAQANIVPKLPAGTKLITPDLKDGAFVTQASLNSVISSLGGSKVVLIAYSAGYKAIDQATRAMNTDQLKRVKTLIALDSPYSGFENAVKRVQSVNPAVEVRRFTAGQFNTNHGRLPGASGVGDAVAALSLAAQNDTTANLPSSIFNNSQPTPLTNVGLQAQQTPTQPSSLYQQSTNSVSPIPLPYMTTQLQQTFQTSALPQQMAPTVQNAVRASRDVYDQALLASTSKPVSFSWVSIGGSATMDIPTPQTSDVVVSPTIVSNIVSPQTFNATSLTTFRSPDMMNMPRQISPTIRTATGDNVFLSSLQTAMRNLLNVLQNMIRL